jgi:large subunit ribosomal protein L28
MIRKNVCASCGKGIQYSNLVSHAKNRSRIIRKPNLHSVRVLVSGKVVRQRLCTKCTRSAIRPHKVALAAAQKAVSVSA